MDAFEFVRAWIGAPFNTVILDPPYNIRKAREKYGNRYIGKYQKLKNTLPNILTHDARVVSFGYDTVGMSKRRGFYKIAACIICHGGDHNDTLGLVEQRNALDLERLKNV